MPQAAFVALATALFNIGAPIAVVNAAYGIGVAGAVFQAAVGLGLTLAASYGANALLGGRDRPAVPTPEDGKYNLKQNIPPLRFVYGLRKISGDYVFLEERGGTAYHVIVHAAHEINGYVSHYLGDSVATFDENGDFVSINSEDEDSDRYYNQGGVAKVHIDTRTGLSAETAYADLVSDFSDVWDADHRGDGLASVLMRVDSVGANDHTTVFPNSMPAHSCVVEGKKLLDPRTNTTAYSTNLALIRLDHELSVFGGKKSLEDIDLDSWKAFADICDENVLNRDGGTEKRYHGGIHGSFETDQVEVAKELDRAADAVTYETREGKLAVHPGKWVEPIIHITRADISSFAYNANRNPAEHIIAVRGRYVDPDQDFNKVDAAIYGDVYVTDDNERAKTVDSEVVSSHNHIQRLQKIKYIRSRAPEVSIVCDYWSARNLPEKRWVKVTKPPQLIDAYVEIIEKPKLHLSPELKWEFSGLVVPRTIYDFDPATEEGTPGSTPVKIGSDGVPDVSNFAVTIQSGDIGNGTVGAYAVATFANESDALTYELEYGQTSGGATSNLTATNGDAEIETGYLVDNVEYEFRMRARAANGSYGDWTDYITLTAVADPTAPDAPTSFTATGAASYVTLQWTNPNSANLVSIRIYRNTVDDFATATFVNPVYNNGTSYSDGILAADDYYYWITAANGSGRESASVAASNNPATVT